VAQSAAAKDMQNCKASDAVDSLRLCLCRVTNLSDCKIALCHLETPKLLLQKSIRAPHHALPTYITDCSPIGQNSQTNYKPLYTHRLFMTYTMLPPADCITQKLSHSVTLLRGLWALDAPPKAFVPFSRSSQSTDPKIQTSL